MPAAASPLSFSPRISAYLFVFDLVRFSYITFFFTRKFVQPIIRWNEKPKSSRGQIKFRNVLPHPNKKKTLIRRED